MASNRVQKTVNYSTLHNVQLMKLYVIWQWWGGEILRVTVTGVMRIYKLFSTQYYWKCNAEWINLLDINQVVHKTGAVLGGCKVCIMQQLQALELLFPVTVEIQPGKHTGSCINDILSFDLSHLWIYTCWHHIPLTVSISHSQTQGIRQ